MAGWVGMPSSSPLHTKAPINPIKSYIVTGFFDSQPLEKQLGNVECNATAAVGLTHHFVGELIKARVVLWVDGVVPWRAWGD